MTRLRGVLRLVALVGLVGLALLGSAGPAAAHNTLVSSDPADGARLTNAPQRVTLVFDQPLPQGLNTITITGPGGTRWETGEVTTRGNSMSVAMRPPGPAGEYLIGYRIVSADGHPLTGVVRFQLTTPAPATSTTAAPTTTQMPAGTPSPAATSPPGSGGGPMWPWAVGVVALAAVAALAALRLGRLGRRRPKPSPLR
jgi:copper resistance protein C